MGRQVPIIGDIDQNIILGANLLEAIFILQQVLDPFLHVRNISKSVIVKNLQFGIDQAWPAAFAKVQEAFVTVH
jgi:hypothetical protein